NGFDIFLKDDFLFTTYNALLIFDISIPASTSLIGQLGKSSYGFIWAVDVVSNFVYVVDMWSGLLIFDISNLLSPIEVGQYNPFGTIRHIKVIGNYAFLNVFGVGIEVIDISNPAAPTLIGRYESFLVNGVSHNVFHIWDAFISEDYAYVIASEDKLIIIDLSQLDSLTATGTLVLTNSTSSIFVEKNKAYLGCESGMLIIDVKNKANPKEVGVFIDKNSYGIGDIAVTGKYAVTAYGDSLELLNVGRSTNVKKIITIDADFSAMSVGIAGKYVWGSYMDFRLYDLDDPDKPVFITSYFDNESTGCLDPWDLNQVMREVIVRDNIAFIAYGANGFIIIRLPVLATGKINVNFSVIIGSLIVVSFIALITRKKKRK
ncbi:MAG: LVIVD repeat-containing protein, partial [Candidatus Heimdallarchaeota archaeon]